MHGQSQYNCQKPLLFEYHRGKPLNPIFFCSKLIQSRKKLIILLTENYKQKKLYRLLISRRICHNTWLDYCFTRPAHCLQLWYVLACSLDQRNPTDHLGCWWRSVGNITRRKNKSKIRRISKVNKNENWKWMCCMCSIECGWRTVNMRSIMEQIERNVPNNAERSDWIVVCAVNVFVFFRYYFVGMG